MNQRDHSSESSRFDVEAAWDFLSELLEEFCNRWESAPPTPDFAHFANRIQTINDAEFRRIGLIELVKVELEFRSKDSFESREVGFYVEQWPELAPDGTPPTELTEDEPSVLGAIDSRLAATSAFRSQAIEAFQPGDSIDDFELLSPLGKGTFANVFLARQKSMQRLVALKISADTGFEGPVLAKLDHPHIVRVYDQRILNEPPVKLMYMEYVAGGALDTVMVRARENGAISPEAFLKGLDGQLADFGKSAPAISQHRRWLADASWSQTVALVGSQLAIAIEYAHDKGVLHRDIKPANVLLDEHGLPKLVDFNISFGESVLGDTAASSFGGSLGYMSPEQLQAFHPLLSTSAEEVGAPADVYSLGVTLYELLQGQRPFSLSAKTDLELVDAMIDLRRSGLTPELRGQLRQHGPLLSDVILNMLQSDPNTRPGPGTVSRALNWASDGEVDGFLVPPERSGQRWRDFACRFPSVLILGLTMAIGIFGAWFIISYNVAESVAEKDQSLFESTRTWINRIVFPLACVVFLLLFQKVRRGLIPRVDTSLDSPSHPNPNSNFTDAMKSNLGFGHAVALTFIATWSVCGCLYPVILSLRGAEISLNSCVDFVLSHVVAGVVSGAFVFFGITLLSVAVWHPRLAWLAMKQGIFPDMTQPVSQTRRRIYFYRVLAIGAPLVAIAGLVNFRDSNSLAVSVLSLGAIIGLSAIAFAIKYCDRALKTIERM